MAWMGYDTPRKLSDRASGGTLALPIWIDYMRTALADAPVELPSVPEGVVNIDGEWYFREYTPDSGVHSLGVPPMPPASTEDERRSILDLFKD